MLPPLVSNSLRRGPPVSFFHCDLTFQIIHQIPSNSNTSHTPLLFVAFAIAMPDSSVSVFNHETLRLNCLPVTAPPVSSHPRGILFSAAEHQFSELKKRSRVGGTSSLSRSNLSVREALQRLRRPMCGKSVTFQERPHPSSGCARPGAKPHERVWPRRQVRDLPHIRRHSLNLGSTD
jgi:hypothetical protein